MNVFNQQQGYNAQAAGARADQAGAWGDMAQGIGKAGLQTAGMGLDYTTRMAEAKAAKKYGGGASGSYG